MTSKVVTKQELRDQIQRYLYTCSTSNPEFLQFINRNKQKITQYMVKHNLFEQRHHENLSEKEVLRTNIERYIHAFKLSKEMNEPDNIFRKADYLFNLVGVTLNTAAFLNTIELLGNDQQAEKWRKLVLSGQVFGGYGQTELGHGSNVQGLETQAHYDEKKQVFRIKSPTVTSAKFWPGILGMVSTHNVIQAKTFVKGQNIGIQTFVFQLRDENLQPLKGIKAGDIGPKFGFHRVDNGFLVVDNVEIPRDNMLMKYIQVTPDGQVKGRENKQAIKYAYGSMLYLRTSLPYNFAFSHIVQPTRSLALLYEKMGVFDQPDYKRKIINYLSVGQGLVIANMYSTKLFNNFIGQINVKNFTKADKILAKAHIISATFKALSSWKALKVSTQLATTNQYTVFRTTGLPYSYNYVLPSVTYQGDNSVLLQQTAKFILMKDKGQELLRPNQLLRDDDIEGVFKTLKYVSSMEIRRLKKVFQAQFEAGIPFKTIWNEKHQRDIIEVSKLWGVRQLVEGFLDTLKDVGSLRSYFTKIGKVFIKNLLDDTPQFFTYGFKIQEIQSWKEFTQEEVWAMTHIQRPVPAPHEEHKLLPRQGNWIRSKL